MSSDRRQKLQAELAAKTAQAVDRVGQRQGLCRNGRSDQGADPRGEITSAPLSRDDWERIRRASMQAFPKVLDGLPADGVLLSYQQELFQAVSSHALVATDKSRRVGATWGIGAAAVLFSGAERSAGGMDTLYRL
ncbi:hypothetical protein V6L77_00695 [Pannonibacter sp. Pt2-lr]